MKIIDLLKLDKEELHQKAQKVRDRESAKFRKALDKHLNYNFKSFLCSFGKFIKVLKSRG